MAEYIEQEGLIQAVREYAGFFQDSPSTDHMILEIEAENIIRDYESADVAPVVHGRWIYGEDIDIQCSVCGADALTEGDYRQVKSRYCPNCGAKMDLED